MMSKAVIEALERRVLLSTYIVTGTGDGSGSITQTSPTEFTVSTLRTAINAVDSAGGTNTIEFQSGVTGTIAITQGALPTLTGANTTIQGPGAGALTINAEGLGSVFQISAGVHAEFHGLSITDGITGIKAFSSTDNITVTDCAISGNSNVGILNIGTAYVADSTISGNGNTTSSEYGGGIDNSGILSVKYCTISGNQIGSFGGGIYNSGSATIAGSTISGNSASRGGGGVANLQYGTVQVDNCTITGNSSANGGGIYDYSTDGAVTVTGCTLSGNTANTGGGIYSRSSSAAVLNSTLSTNSAVSQGGAIANMDAGILNVTDSTISGNSANISGGGIYSSNDSQVYLTNSTMSRNTAAYGYGGGTFISNNTTLKVAGCTISGNSSSLGGGGIYAQYYVGPQVCTTYVTNSTLSGNSSSGNGGGIGSGGALTIYDSTLCQNQAYGDGDGGGIDNNDGTLAITNSTLTGNVASGSDGGGILGTGTITDCTITGNSAHSSGGGIWGSGSTINGTIIVGNTTVSNNSTLGDVSGNSDTGSNNLTGNGSGGLPSSGHNNTFGVALASVKLSSLGYYGGPTETIALLPGSDAINQGYNGVSTDQRGFARNSTTHYDIGAFQTDNGTESLVVTTSQDDPVPLGQLSLRDAIDLANVLGSAQTITFGSSLTNSPSTIDLSESLGALPINDGNHLLSIVDTTVNPVTINAQLQSDVFDFGPNSEASFQGLNIIDGELGIHDIASTDNLSVKDCTITGNTEGGIVSGAGTTYLGYTTLWGNQSGDNGGGISSGGSLTVKDCTITGNTASNDGGGIYNSGTAAITDSTISGNSAKYGGGVYGPVTLYGSIVAGNIISGSAVPSDLLSGTADTGTHTLIGDGSGGLSSATSSHNILGTTDSPINPLLAPLGNYDDAGTSSPETMALLPGSPAIGAGASFGGITKDERGVTRPSSGIDIGAYQDRGFTLTLVSGNNQIAPINTPFADLVVSVASDDSGLTNLSGGIVTFTAPTSGSSVIWSQNPSSNSIPVLIAGSNEALAMGEANNTAGAVTESGSTISVSSYNVAASIAGSSNSETFALTNAGVTLNLTATATAPTETIPYAIDLQWVNASEAASSGVAYYIYRKTASTNFTLIATTSSTPPTYAPSTTVPPANLISSYTDAGTSPNALQPDTQYFYEVQAVNPATGWSYTYDIASAATGSGSGYSATPLGINSGGSPNTFTLDVPISNSGSPSTQANSVSTSVSLLTGEHYEVMASGEIDLNSSGLVADSEYSNNDGAFALNSIIPVGFTDSGGSYLGGGFVNYGVGINDSNLDSNKYPYWGTYNSAGDYEVDIVGTGAPISFDFHDDRYSDNSNGSGDQPIEVEIFPALPMTPTNVTATADDVNDQIVLSFTNNASPEAGFQIMRKEDSGSFEPLSLSDTPILSSSTVVAGTTVTVYDNSTTDPSGSPVPGHTYTYEVVAVGPYTNDNSPESAPSSAILASATGSISGHVYEQISTINSPSSHSLPATVTSVELNPIVPNYTSGTPSLFQSLGDDGAVYYEPDNALLDPDGGLDGIVEINLPPSGQTTPIAQKFIDFNSTTPDNFLLGTGKTDIDDETTLLTVQPGNAAGFSTDDIFIADGVKNATGLPGGSYSNPGQIGVIFDDGTQFKADWTTLPVPAGAVINAETFIDNSDAFGGDMLVMDSDNDVFVVDAKGDYTEVGANVAPPPVGQSYSPDDSGGLVSVPNNPAVWGPYAGTILVFPEYNTRNDVSTSYPAYDLSLSSSDGGAMSPELTVSPADIQMSVFPNTGSNDVWSSTEWAGIIPTNADLYVTVDTNGNPLDAIEASNFSGMAGDILLEGGEDNNTLADVYYNSSAGTLTGRTFDTSIDSTTGFEAFTFGPPGFVASETDTYSAPLPNRTVYIDENGSGQYEPNDPTALTDSNGNYVFNNLPTGTYQIGQILPPLWSQIQPSQPEYTETISTPGQSIGGVDFASENSVGPISPPVITTQPNSTAILGSTYQYSFSATEANANVPIVYDLPEHPDGMTINDSNPASPEIVWNVPAASSVTQYADVVLRATVTDPVTGQIYTADQPFTLQYTNPASTVAAQPGGSSAVDLSWAPISTGVAGDTVTYYIDRLQAVNGTFPSVNTNLLSTTSQMVGNTAENFPNWLQVDSANGYYLETSSDGNDYIVDTGTAMGDSPSLSPNTSYQYTIMAAISSSTTTYPVTIDLGAATAATNPTGSAAPVAPWGLTSTVTVDGSGNPEFNLEWYGNQDGANTTGYEVLRSPSNLLSSAAVIASGTFSSSTTPPFLSRSPDAFFTYTDDSGFTSGATYYYWIEAYTGTPTPANSSGPSNVASATATVPFVTGITATEKTDHLGFNLSPITTLTSTSAAWSWSVSGEGHTYNSTAPSNPNFSVDSLAEGTYTATVTVTFDSETYNTSTSLPLNPYPTNVVVTQGSEFSPEVVPYTGAVDDQWGNPFDPSSPPPITWSASYVVGDQTVPSIVAMPDGVLGVPTGVPSGTVFNVNASAAGPTTGSATYSYTAGSIVPQFGTPTETASTVQLSWTAPTGLGSSTVTSYDLWRFGSDGSFQAISNDITRTSFVDSGLTPSTQYTYYLSANLFTGGVTSRSDSASIAATTWALPNTPREVTATALSSTQIELNWPNDPGPQGPGWVILRAVGSGGSTPPSQSSFQRILLNGDPSQVDGAPEYNDDNLSPNTQYWYEVESGNQVIDDSNGNFLSFEVSPPSAPVSATTLPGGPVNEAPTDLTTTLVAWQSNTESVDVGLAWNYNGQGASGFNIYRDNGPGSSFTKIGSSTSTTFSFQDTTAAAVNGYQYEVSAIYSEVTPAVELYSNIIFVNTPAASGAPNPPTNLQISSPGSNSTILNLSWLAPLTGSVSGYNIYRAANPDGPWTKLNTSGLVTATSYSDTDPTLTGSTTYYYEIKSVVSGSPAKESEPLSGSGVTSSTGSNIIILRPINGPANASDNPSDVQPLTQPTPISAVVGTTDGDALPWSLKLIPVGGSNIAEPIPVASGTGLIGSPAGGAAAPLTTLANGVSQQVSLNPSLYPAGEYLLQLSDTNSGGPSSQVPVTLGSPIQLGNFTLPVTDMTVNVPGESPIVISRVYNSTNASVPGGLGYGWQFSFASADVHSTAGFISQTDQTGYTFGDILYVTLPDGEQHAFQFLPVPAGYNSDPTIGDNPLAYAEVLNAPFTPQFVAVDGSNAKLTLNSAGADSLYYDQTEGSPYEGMFTTEDGQTPYDPAAAAFGGGFSVTTSDGTVYNFAPNSGTGAMQVQTVTDPEGNATTYSYDENGTPTSIASGNVVVTFTKLSGTSLVDHITVAAGGTETGQAVFYHYDTTGGVDNLTGVTQPQDIAEHVVSGNTIPNTSQTVNTFLYVYSTPSTHYLTSIENEEGSTTAVSYDSSSDELSGLTSPSDQAVPIATAAAAQTPGGATSQTVSNPDGSTTEDIYDAHGNLIRQIQSILEPGTSTVAGYDVTVHTYDYGTFNIEDAEYIGSSIGPNTVFDEADYQPFFVAGTDSAGLRFTQNATQLASETNYYFSTLDDNIPLSDNGQIEEQTMYTENSNGALVPQTTSYGDYTDGKPGTIVDPSGAYTVNIYSTDGKGNLLSTKQFASETAYADNLAPLSETDYTYTNGVSNVPSGLPVATTRPGNGGSGSITESSNDYFGTVSGTSPSYVVALPGSADPYDSAGMLASTTDVNNVPTFYDYDELGDQILSYTPKSTDEGNSPNSWVVTITQYDWDGRVTDTKTGTFVGTGTPSFTVSASSTTPGAVTFNTTTNPIYNDISQSNGGSLVTTHTNYDASGRVQNSTDQYGGVTSYVFDVSGNLIETINPDGTETITEYDTQNRPILSTDPFNPANTSIPIVGTETKYDSAGRVIETDRVSGIGISVTGITGDVGTVSVTASGTVQSSTTTVYNPNGSVASTTDAEGLTTAYTYYPNGQEQTVTEENAAVSGFNTSQAIATLYNYDADGRQTSVVGPTGVLESATVYDALGRVIKTIYADGSFTETLYSVEGEPVTVDGEGEAIPQPSGLTIPTGGSETVQIAQRKVGDAINATFDIYDKAGNLVEVYQPEVLNNAGTSDVYPETTYAYDVNGNETSQTDANGNVTHYTYDENGNMLTETLPNGESESCKYNQFGQVATQTDFDGNVATYTYYTSGVNAGKEEEVVYTGSGKTTQTVTYTYDNLGRQSTVTDASGTTTYSYDANSNLIEQNTPEGIVNYHYNALNQQTDMWTGNVAYVSRSSAETWTQYAYDDLGRLTTVTQSRLNDSTVNDVTSYGYDINGNKVSEVDPNGDTTVYTYDALNRLVGEIVKNGTTLMYSVAYTLQDDGMRISAAETEAQPSGGPATITTAWTYDHLDRLTGEAITSSLSGQSLATTFAYDLVGNRTQENISGGSGVNGGLTINYTYNSDDQLTDEKEIQHGGSTVYETIYGYDNNGSLIGSVRTGSGAITDSYVYDVRNRMASATIGGVTTTYLYRDDGIRVSETSGSNTTTYLIDDNNPTGYAQTIEEHVNGSSTPSVTYFLGDTVYGQANGTTILDLVRDGHGNTRLVVSSTGTVLATYNYDAWSNPDGFTFASALTTHLTADGDADVATSFEYQDSRWRSGANYTQRDNIELTPGDLMNADLYVYLGGNPLNGTDTTGHDDDLAEELTLTGDQALLIGIGLGVAIAAVGLSHQTGAFVTAATDALNDVQDWLASGAAALETAATKVAGQTAKLEQAIQGAISDAIDAGVATAEELSELPIFPVIKSLGPHVYAFDVAALAANPLWYVLNYLGPNSLQTARNRAIVTGAYGALMASAPPGYQLDEFPYASTQQGGVGAIGSPVPALENAIQGGLLSALYRYSLKGIPGAPFLVVPINI
jgi:YD repeat-containing protein